MKLLLSFLIFLSFNLAWAGYEADDMNEALIKGQYELLHEIYEDSDKEFFEKSLEMHFLEAKTLELEGKIQEAIDIYVKILKEKFAWKSKEFNNQLREMRRKRSRKLYVDRQKFDSDFRLVYFKLAQLYGKLSTTINIDTPPKTKKKILRSALYYLKRSRILEEEKEQVDNLGLQIRNSVKELKKYDVESSFYISTGVITWQDHVVGYDQEFTTSLSFLNSSKGNCSGIGYMREDAFSEFFVDYCMISAKSTLASNYASLTAVQDNVSVSGALAGIGYYTKRLTEKVRLGLQGLYFQRSGKWVSFSSTISIQEKDLTGYGLSFNTKYVVDPLFFTLKFARVFNTKSSLLTLQTSYRF